jgi:hypothetical protein
MEIKGKWILERQERGAKEAYILFCGVVSAKAF